MQSHGLPAAASRAWPAWTLLACLVTPACQAQQHAFDGTYTVAVAGQAMTLVVESLPNGEVRGWLRASDSAVFQLTGRFEVDEEGDETVQGLLAGASGRGDFTLMRDDELHYQLLLIPYDGVGTPRTDQASIYAITRISDEITQLGTDDAPDAPAPVAAGSAPAAASATAGIQRDPRLVGHWATQVIMNSPEGSIATELRMQLGADGVMTDLGSRTLGSVDGTGVEAGPESGGERAAWRTEEDLVLISYAGSQWVPFARYQLSGNSLLLVYLHDGSRQLWSRASTP